MANALYPAYKRALMNKQIDMVNDTIKAALFKAPFAWDNNFLSADVTSALAGSELVGTPVTITSKIVDDFGTSVSSPANAAFDCADITFTSVAAGDTVTTLLLYHDSTKTPIAFIDTGTGLPFVTNGGNVTMNISNSITRVFAL